MYFYEFLRYKQEQRAQAIWDLGRFVAVRYVDKLKICLYELELFYAEIWYEPTENRIVDVKGFTSLSYLAQYKNLAHTSKNKQVHYFKRLQEKDIYHYYEVVGGSGKTKHGYQTVINFLNPFPIICIEHNFDHDPSGLTGTWCQFEVGVPITDQEYKEAFERAINHPDTKFM